ncbi:hybrid sensor histidine kinase/response regulator [Sphingomonas soli]|uniref:hybrid sensor histidine kinase/response regulator n=1 Tax=Sphingomonas soli TaxID=266127 RepID=UPI00082E58BD|nr:PAS domain S-box protein [Sphingomonas soli]
MNDEGSGFLKGGGQLSELIAAFDWSKTSMGPIANWPQPIKAVVGMALRAPVPIVMLFGESGVMIYNDAYSEFAGSRHPDLLGMDVREAWPEVADFNDHVVETVFRKGQTLSYKDQELKLQRHGQLEPVWLDLDYSPIIDEEGTPLGVIAIVVETTEKVLADRQLRDERIRLEQMYAQAPNFMALLEGPEHRYVMANPAYTRVVGGRDVIGKTVAEALPEAVAQGYLAMLDQVYSSGKALVLTGARFDLGQPEDGSVPERFVDFVYQPIIDGSGMVTGIFVNGVDATERVQARNAINASEAEFRAFAQAMPNHVWTSAPTGMLDWFNDRVVEYCGRSAEELRGVGWAATVHPDDRDGAAARWAHSIETGESYETEFRIENGNGEYRWHLVRALPIRTADGHILRWIGSNTDIDDQKLLEAETARDRDRMWTLSQDLMMVSDYQGIVIAANPTATRMLGWTPAELVGKPISDFIHPDDLDATAAEIEKLAGGESTLAFENRWRSIHGTYRLFAWTAVPDEGRIHAIGRDITRERLLARERERIWNLSPVVKVVVNLAGEVFAVNPSWERVLGWSEQETIGRDIRDFIDPSDVDNATRRLAELPYDHALPEHDTVFRTKDGELRRIAFTSVLEGETIYGFGRDVTAEREAAEALATTEEALRQSQKMEAVGQLTGGIAHDFNNLLQGITGSLEIIERRVSQGRLTEIGRFLAGATTAANRAAALTHRLLAFSRRQPLDPRPVRANPLVASMEDLLRRTIGERVELELVLAGGLWLTLCDPNQLENALLNLVINARDAMPEGGKLTIETCNAHLDDAYAARQRDVKPGQYVCICVTDTGTGMDADTIAKAFEPFFTTKPIGQGTGLGLSMIYGFARQSDGYAKIYSEMGKGTTFKLYLPRFRGQAESDEEVPQLSEAHATDAGEVVLVVEDEPVVRGLIVETLSELGYRAIEAGDGPKGVEILRSKKRIDLLITDIGLPGLNGRQVADAGRAVRPELKVLFMTGYAENAALASGFLEPGMTMITKPFAMEALATRIRTIIEG